MGHGPCSRTFNSLRIGNVSVGMQDSGWAKRYSLKVLGSMSEDKFHLDVTRQRSRVWPAIRGNILNNSTGRDKHQKGIR